MLNIGESPKDAKEYTLSQILEDNVPQKYFLSAKACEGILRRAKEKGKQIAPELEQALLNTIRYRSMQTPQTADSKSQGGYSTYPDLPDGNRR